MPSNVWRWHRPLKPPLRHTFTKRGRWGIALLLWASWVPIKYQKGQTGPLTSVFHENTSELKYSQLGTDLTPRPSQRRACQPRRSSSRLADLGTGPSVTSHFPVQTLSQASGNYWDPRYLEQGYLLPSWTDAGPFMQSADALLRFDWAPLPLGPASLCQFLERTTWQFFWWKMRAFSLGLIRKCLSISLQFLSPMHIGWWTCSSCQMIREECSIYFHRCASALLWSGKLAMYSYKIWAGFPQD